jgi:hypothetical protein
MAVTALTLIKSAMSKINKLQSGEVPAAEDIVVGIERLNALLGSYESDNLFNYASTETIATLPANTTSRTIGTGLQINVARPVRILKGSFTRVGTIDYDLEPISEAEYNSFSLKSSISSVAPAVCFYDGDTTTASVFFYPVAVTSVELHIITPTPSGTAATENTSFNFPQGYQRMLENNLAIEIAPDFNTVPSQILVAMAASSKRALKNVNRRVPQLDVRYRERGNMTAGDFIGGNF